MSRLHTKLAVAAWSIVALLMLAGAWRLCAQGGDEPRRLPTGARLDPAGRTTPLGSMPLAMVFSPDSSRIVAILCGFRAQGVQIIDAATGQVTQTLVQPAAFLGVAFARDGRSLYVSGGDRDCIYRYAWDGARATLADSIVLAGADSVDHGTRYPAGLAVSPDGRHLYVAENLADSLAVVDLARGRVVQSLATGPYPYGVVVDAGGRAYVSAWGGSAIATFAPGADGLSAGPSIAVGRHPSVMALNASGTRLFVARASFDRIAVVDTRANAVMTELRDTPAGAPSEGSTPNAFALSADGARLFVAEADHNALAVFDLAAKTADAPRGPANDQLAGRVPVEWYPTAVLARRDTLYVLNGKGHGTAPTAGRLQPGTKGHRDPTQYTLGQLAGSLTTLALPRRASLAAYSARVERADRLAGPAAATRFPPFRHVIYVIKENRTYDQILGDMPQGDGDTSLVYFGRGVTPNAHALAERCGLFDRFETNAEVSGQGHNWSTAAYASDYVEKTVPSVYSGRGRSYDYEGLNRDTTTDDDVSEPGSGYIWDAAARAGVSMRNYGEFTHLGRPGYWVANKASLDRSTCHTFPGFDLDIRDQARVDAWLADFRRCEAADSFPQLSLMRLPNDHTAGATVGSPTPRAFMADNDLALGRMIEALSRSRFWKDTVVFVLEDDAQDGPDHVDSHRAPLLVISAWSRPGVVHRFANTSDVLATIGRILHMSPLSQFDAFGWPIDGIFADHPNLAPYTALQPATSLDEKNPADTPGAKAMGALDLRREDPPNEDLFNRILWAMIKGPARPYPARD